MKEKQIYGIIDMGSNTIRLSIYRCKGSEFQLLMSKKVVAGLAGYIEDGELSQKGIRKACAVMKSYKSILENFSIEEYYAFATASLRNASNREAVRQLIKEHSGVEVEILSGENEARLDFEGAVKGMELRNGVLIDVGGGSTELIIYEEGRVMQAYSLPVGCLSLYNKHVKKLFPNDKKKREIRNEVLGELKKIDGLERRKYERICGVGGTVRAAAALNNDIYSLGGMKREVSTENIGIILSMFSNTDKTTLRRILQVVPERIHTIIPGMIILDTLAKYFYSENIYVSAYGVREGFLSKVLENQEAAI